MGIFDRYIPQTQGNYTAPFGMGYVAAPPAPYVPISAPTPVQMPYLAPEIPYLVPENINIINAPPPAPFGGLSVTQAPFAPTSYAYPDAGTSSSFAPPVGITSIDDVSYGPSWANLNITNAPSPTPFGGLSVTQDPQMRNPQQTLEDKRQPSVDDTGYLPAGHPWFSTPEGQAFLAKNPSLAYQAQPSTVGGLSAAAPVTPASAYGPYVPGAKPPVYDPSAPSINVSNYVAPPTGLDRYATPGSPLNINLPEATTTVSGAQIFGPTATVVGDTMYTSDGRVITNPIVSDYQQYGLTAPQGTPTVSPKANASIFGQPTTGVRSESLYTGAAAPVGNDVVSQIYGQNAQQTTNPYAAFNTGQDITQPYVTASGDLILPGGRIVRDPTAADFDQYGISLNKEFSRSSYTPEEKAKYNQMVADASTAADKAYQDAITKGADKATATQISQAVKNQALRAADTFLGKNAYTTEEQGAYNQIIKTGNSAADILYQSAIANGIDKKTAQGMADSVRNDYQQQANDYRGSAYLPGDQVYKNFYTKTAEEFLGDMPEDQRFWKVNAQQVFNSLPPEEQKKTSIKTIQSNIDTLRNSTNPADVAKVNIPLTPELVQELANSGVYNLGTKLVGVNYDSLAKDDPTHLKAINEATNKFNLGLNLINDWGLFQGSKNGKTSTGVSVQMASAIAQGLADGIVAPEDIKSMMPDLSDKGVKEWTEFANDMAKLRGDKDITTADLREIAKGGSAPKLAPGTDDTYIVTTSGGKKGGQYVILKKTGEDSYRIAGGTSSFTPTGGNFWSKYFPVIAGIGLALIPGMQGFATQVGTALGAGTAYAPVVGGAVLGAGKSALFGGDPLIGAISGGVGGYAGNVLGDVDIAGLPLKPGVVGGLASMASNAAGNALAGNPILPGLQSGLMNLGVNLISPEIAGTIKNALPAGTPNVLANSLAGGLTSAGISSLAGFDPVVSGVMGATGPLINYGVQQTGLTGLPANMVTGALSGAAQTALRNQDPRFGAAAGVLAPAFSYGFDALGRYVGLDKLGRPVTRS